MIIPALRGCARSHGAEIAAVKRMDEASAVAKIDDVLAKTARHAKLAAEADSRTRAA